jgi:hypothetical protein
MRWRLTYACLYSPTTRVPTLVGNLVKKLQIVQNEAVKVISRAFWTVTTPREPLHQLLTIFPMDLQYD